VLHHHPAAGTDLYLPRGALLPEAIAATNAPAYAGELASYAHWSWRPASSSAPWGDKIVIAHPLAHDGFAWIFVITGGPALFLVGRAGLDYAAFSRVSRTRLVGIVLLAVAVPVARHLQSIGVAAVTVAVLGAIATSNYVAVRRNPRTPLPPRAPAEQSPR